MDKQSDRLYMVMTMRYKKLNDYIGIMDINAADKYDVKIDWKRGNWIRGKVKGLKFEAQIFNKPSMSGLYKGRISRLFIIRKGCPHWGDTIYHYERGLGDKPTEEGKRLSRQFLKIFPKKI